MKTKETYTVDQAGSASLMTLQKMAKSLNVSHSHGTKKHILRGKVIKAIDLSKKKPSAPITIQSVSKATLPVLKAFAKELKVSVPKGAKKQAYVLALTAHLSAKPEPIKETPTVSSDAPEGAIKLRDLKDGQKFSFIRKGEPQKPVYLLVRKMDDAVIAAESDGKGEWKAKILGYTVLPRLEAKA